MSIAGARLAIVPVLGVLVATPAGATTAVPATRAIGASANAPAGASARPAISTAVPWEKPVGGIAWLTDYNVGLQKALVMRRPVLLTFYTDWCGWCRKLESSTFPDPRMAALVRFVVPVRVNGDRERSLATLMRVTAYPTTVLLDRSGREIGRITGYRDADQFVQTLSSFLSRREPIDDPEALYHLADVYLSVGRYEDARVVLGQVAALSTPQAKQLAPDVILDGALTHLFAHEYAAALPGFEDYLARFPKGDRRDEALFFYGTALLGAGHPAEGRAKLAEAEAVTSIEYIKLESERLRNLAQEATTRGQR